MEKKKIDLVIEAFRNYINLKEDMMATQSTNGKPGFSSDSNDQGPVAGFSPLMSFVKRKSIKKYASLGSGSRKRWMKK